jgi:DME family drug/metabolite transporter
LVDAALFGIALALGSAFCFAGNRAVGSGPLSARDSDPVFVNYMSLLVGVPIAFVAAAGSLQVFDLPMITLFAAVLFVAAGIFHFGLGRTLSYTSIKHVGANPTSALLTTQALYSLVLAFLLLNETLNTGIVVGTLLIVFGILFMEGRLSAAKRGGVAKFGYIAALSAGLIFGITPVVIKAGLTSFHYYAAATLISFSAALLAYTLWVTPRRFAASVKKVPRSSMISYLVMGMFGISAQLMRYASLSMLPVVIVAPILATHPVFTVLLTSRLSKEKELFNARTITSILIAASGAVIVGYSAGA